jgi:hypothetical protein
MFFFNRSFESGGQGGGVFLMLSPPPGKSGDHPRNSETGEASDEGSPPFSTLHVVTDPPGGTPPGAGFITNVRWHPARSPDWCHHCYKNLKPADS